MNKDAMTIGALLIFVFFVSLGAHMLYGRGHAGKAGDKDHVERERVISVFSTQEACRKQTGAKECVLHLCDNVPAGEEFEDVCGQGFKRGWTPKADRH